MKNKRHKWFQVILSVLCCAILIFIAGCKDDDSGDGNSNGTLSITGFYPNSGNAGTLVTINGEGFSRSLQQNSVTFNGIEADVFSASNTRLVVLAPKDGSSGKIQLQVGNQLAEVGDYVYQKLSIAEISPERGPAGTNVRISGAGFSSLDSLVKASFNGKGAIISSASDTVLVVRVPEGAGVGNVTVSVDGKSSVGPMFHLMEIVSIQPMSGGAGTTITINGSGFGEDIVSNHVEINGEVAQILDVTSSQLIVQAPERVASGRVSFEVDGQKVFGPDFSVVAPPVIRSVSPLSGPVGTAMTIKGSFFSDNLDENKVWINGKEATITNATHSEIQLTVPAEVEAEGVVRLVVNGQETTGPNFKLQNLGILSVSREGAWYGESIHITGMGFSAVPEDNIVTFNGVSGIVTQASAGELTVVTPASFASGVLRVRVGGLSADAPSVFYRQGVETIAEIPGLTSYRAYYMAINSKDELFIADLGRILKLTPNEDGSYSVNQNWHVFSSSTTYAQGLAIDKDDNLYASIGRDIYQITDAEEILTVSYNSTLGTLCADKEGEHLYFGYAYPQEYNIADGYYSQIGNYYMSQSGVHPAAKGRYYYALLSYNTRIYRFDSRLGTYTALAGSSSSGHVDGSFSNARFNNLYALRFDHEGYLLALDSPFGQGMSIRKLDFDNEQVSTIATFNYSTVSVDGSFMDATFNGSHDFVVDKAGNLIVLDSNGLKVRKILLK